MENKSIKFDEKEVALVKRQASGSMDVAQELVINNAQDLQKAITLLSKIKQALKLIREKKEEFTKPARDIVKSARDLFKPLEDQCLNAERIIKAKMVDANDREEAKAIRAEEKVIEKVEAGKITPKEASEKLDEIAPEKVVEAKGGKIQYKKKREVVIDDETKIPREYMMLDMVRIRRDALAGKKIAGVKVIEKKIVASSSY